MNENKKKAKISKIIELKFIFSPILLAFNTYIIVYVPLLKTF